MKWNFPVFIVRTATLCIYAGRASFLNQVISYVLSFQCKSMRGFCVFFFFFFPQFRCSLCSCNRCFLKQMVEREKYKLHSSVEYRTKAAHSPFEMGTFLEHCLSEYMLNNNKKVFLSDIVMTAVWQRSAQKGFSINRLLFLNGLTVFLPKSLLSTRFAYYFNTYENFLAVLYVYK